MESFQTAYAHNPDLIVEPRTAEEVAAAVRNAAERDLPIGVHATGHGLSVPLDGGVLIDTGHLNGLHIDPDTRIARVEAGVRAGTLLTAAAEHGLAPLSGSSPSVSVIGYLLGSGLGLLARHYGYAADRVRALELVTADGELRRLVPGDALFGAVLGTVGNFGVVTAVELELLPVTEIYGGQLVFDAANAEPVLDAWRAWAATAPDTVTTSAGLLTYPDLEQLPPFLRGRSVVGLRIAFEGTAAEGERLVAPLRAAASTITDDLRIMPYAESGSIHREPPEPHGYAATNAALRRFDAAAQRALLAATGPDTVVDIRQLGGALREPGKSGAAVDFREAEFLVRVITAADGPGRVPALDAVRSALAPWTLGHQLGFLYGAPAAADEAQTRAGFTPETYDRLAALKAEYDPAARFRATRAIVPAR
ncbi:FAD-binding oxidoreductase [Nocardia sp. NPDC050697]|uniref:FAD-binding oxidoreductase n=1 Tax=Nocardia sp. NPDC050697 TaxID=3155158 RepID=UPI0034050D2F